MTNSTPQIVKLDSPFFVVEPDHHPISQPFGVPGETYTKAGMKGHEGTDYRARKGTMIKAVQDFMKLEVVHYKGDPVAQPYGNHVITYHHIDGIYFKVIYAHLSRHFNESFSPGQDDDEFELFRHHIIGWTGSTGNITGPHLHLVLVRTDEKWKTLAPNNGYKGAEDIEPWINKKGVASDWSTKDWEQIKIAGGAGNYTNPQELIQTPGIIRMFEDMGLIKNPTSTISREQLAVILGRVDRGGLHHNDSN